MWNPEIPWEKADFRKKTEKILDPLYYIALYDLRGVVKMLLDAGADVNAQGGEYGNALQTASSRGHEAVVKLLLENGADVNAQGGEYGNALQAASQGGHEQAV